MPEARRPGDYHLWLVGKANRDRREQHAPKSRGLLDEFGDLYQLTPDSEGGMTALCFVNARPRVLFPWSATFPRHEKGPWSWCKSLSAYATIRWLSF